MSANQQQAKPEKPEKFARDAGEAGLLSRILGTSANENPNQAKILANRDSFAGHEVIGVETGEKVRLVEHSEHVTPGKIQKLLWEQVEKKFKQVDAAQAESLVSEITGKQVEQPEQSEVDDDSDNALTQEKRLAKAEIQLKAFFDTLARELTPLINQRQARLLIDESIGDRTTDQLGDKGDVNIALANEAIARKMIEVFQNNSMAFSGYERAFNDKTREGFVLENKESGLRFMFIYDQAMPKNKQLAETPVAQPDAANAQMPDQSAPGDSAADSETQDHTTATAQRTAAVQAALSRQAANDAPPEVEALFGDKVAEAARRNDDKTEDQAA